MTENEYQRRLNKATEQAEFRAFLVAVIALVGIVVYQIWEMFQ